MSNLYFNELNSAGKTRLWEVQATATDSILGLIKFYGAWRKYIFSPVKNALTFFDASCLREIADFTEARSKEWREFVRERATASKAEGETAV